jgi:iron complex outermembrane receptor protein
LLPLMSAVIRFFTIVCAFRMLLGSSPALHAQHTGPVESPDSTTADEVIPLGYDTTTVRTASGTLSTLRPAGFNAGILFNPLNAIAGRLPGLFITPVHGNPNGETTAVLRGWNSLFGSNEPLYVVDGVPGVPVENIAVEDIAQVTLVKDASQAGVYGARAGNGVLIITTRRGERGRPHVTYHGYTGVAHAAARPDVLTAGEYRGVVRQFGRQSDFRDQGASTDWFGEVTRPAFTQNHQLGLSGGAGPSPSGFRAATWAGRA